MLITDIWIVSRFFYYKAAMTILVKVFSWTCFHFFWVGTQDGRCWILDLYMFTFSRDWQVVYQHNYTNLQAQQQYLRVPVALYSHQHLVLLVFLISAILLGVQWYFVVALIYIFLITYSAGQIFLCLLACFIAPLLKFRSFVSLILLLVLFY